MQMDVQLYFKRILAQHKELFDMLNKIEEPVLKACETLHNTLNTGKKILICGNGGSAADSQHFAAELIGRFEKDRKALPAIALTTDTSIITAIGNDNGFHQVFSKQVDGLGDEGDALVGISTSGQSENVLQAVKSARARSMHTIGLLGNQGGILKSVVDIAVVAPHSVTARIQEVHLFIIHFWAAAIEGQLFG